VHQFSTISVLIKLSYSTKLELKTHEIDGKRGHYWKNINI